MVRNMIYHTIGRNVMNHDIEPERDKSRPYGLQTTSAAERDESRPYGLQTTSAAERDESRPYGINHTIRQS